MGTIGVAHSENSIGEIVPFLSRPPNSSSIICFKIYGTDLGLKYLGFASGATDKVTYVPSTFLNFPSNTASYFASISLNLFWPPLLHRLHLENLLPWQLHALQPISVKKCRRLSIHHN